MEDTPQIVRLYQPDYDKLKKVSEDNNISIAEAVNYILSEYERLMSQPQPQVVFQQMQMGGQ